MILRRLTGLCALVCVLVLNLAKLDVMAASAPAGLKKVAIAYSSISPNQAPAWAAYETGIFRKYGLDVQLIFVESGSRTVQTLVSGDVVAAEVAGAGVIQSNLQGSGVVLIAGFLNTLDYNFMVSRDITQPTSSRAKLLRLAVPGRHRILRPDTHWKSTVFSRTRTSPCCRLVRSRPGLRLLKPAK